ncbi:cyclic nucleotide-binding domain-containing protein [Coleofasciculus sp. LEGE 07081]|uniref:cyclic nucleotide-binding domain-containing protein n=1 Tax=unclassified Coleofasciculus TaxID=2692782 RepID=UPI001880E084|nr:cyclic nucleotide-binding domain-containing protein [Coleofasciculus sp. LEGE 07081]MBE9151372.1 cyclic nucleotide-binding domain-containing protein [Coleofasciculus sp. LEGE 07092]
MSMAAFFQGILGASSLALGAVVGVFWQPNRSFSAAIMAFGSGTLLSAIAFEITIPAYRASGFSPLLVGFMAGGALFAGLTQYIDQHGGFLRKPASSRRYLYEHRHEQISDVLARIAHVEVMQNLPPQEKQALVSFLKPVYAQPGDILCEEGTPGDYFYMIVDGEAEVRKGRKVLNTMKPGEVFGEMALLTGEPRSATVVARTPMELYQLHREHFHSVLSWSPHMAWALSRSLAQRLRLATDSRVAVERNLERWRQQLIDQVELDLLLREDPTMIEGLVKRSAPLAILIGTLIDNIPESLVIGMNAGESHFGWSFLLAVFISNFPEALSSASGMKQAGMSRSQILGLWIGIVVLSGLCAVGGYALKNSTSELVVAIAQAVSGGAILAMLASTMMPEAYELGGSSVAFSTILGFLLGFFISSGHIL